MSAALYGRDSAGVNRQIKKLYANVGGVTRELKELWARDSGGVNRKIFSTGAKLSSSPFVETFAFGYGGKTWSFDSSRSSLTFSQDNYISFNTFLGAQSTSDSQTLGRVQSGIMIPIELPEVLSFTVNQPCLRINADLLGVSGNNLTDSDKTNNYVQFPDYMGIALFQGNSLEYVFNSSSVKADSVYSSSYVYHFPVTGTPVAANALNSFTSPYAYLGLYFYKESTHTQTIHSIMQFTCTIPNQAISIIDGSGAEYLVNFEY